MAALLEFMYRGEVHVSQESLSSFLKAAECLQVSRALENARVAIMRIRACVEVPIDSLKATFSDDPRFRGSLSRK